MAVFKRVLCKQRLRQVPPQFSWIDHRLVRDRHISRCSADALALYLFLVTVADGQGLSYYADATICRLLPLRQAQGRPLNEPALARARRELIDNQLIAYQRPLYQVLAIGPDFGELPSGLTSASSVEPSLRVEDSRAVSPSPQPRSSKQAVPRPDPARAGEEPHPLARILRQLAGLDSAPTSPSQKPLDSAQDKP